MNSILAGRVKKKHPDNIISLFKRYRTLKENVPDCPISLRYIKDASCDIYYYIVVHDTVHKFVFNYKTDLRKHGIKQIASASTFIGNLVCHSFVKLIPTSTTKKGPQIFATAINAQPRSYKKVEPKVMLQLYYAAFENKMELYAMPEVQRDNVSMLTCDELPQEESDDRDVNNEPVCHISETIFDMPACDDPPQEPGNDSAGDDYDLLVWGK